jgi:hopanoid biosynthesis associated protein HpnK
MGRPDGQGRLVVNADDFGASRSINTAVLRAHREGILTTASLMVGGAAADEAAELARESPALGVGLHLTLVCGRAVLPPARIPGLADPMGQFSARPAAAGLRYWANSGLRDQLRAELEAQFERFHATGLHMDHVNGHLNLHLHPVVSDLLCENARPWGIERMRLTRDSFRLSLRSTRGRWLYRLSHALIFRALAGRAHARWARNGIRHVDHVLGLHADGQMDEACLLRILERLPRGDVEIYSHPSLDRFRHEFEALISPRVRQRVKELGLSLVRHQDL